MHLSMMVKLVPEGTMNLMARVHVCHQVRKDEEQREED